jgi:ATP-binding cassette subfamily B (MDR/TAP) protein 1
MSISQPFGMLVFEINATIASLIVGFVSSWQLTLAILAAFPLAALALWVVSQGLAAAIETQKRDLTRATKYLNSAFSAIATIKLCNGQDHEIWQYFNVLKDITKAYLKQAWINALQFGVLKFFSVAIFVHGFWFGLFLTQKGLDAGNVVTTFYACLTAVQSVEVILPQWLVLAKGMSAGATLKAIWRELHTEQQARCTRPGFKPTSCSGDIEVKNVCLTSPSLRLLLMATGVLRLPFKSRQRYLIKHYVVLSGR